MDSPQENATSTDSTPASAPSTPVAASPGMPIFYLYRAPRNTYATFSMLAGEDGVPFAVTLELSWHNNQPGVSCIPPGEFVMELTAATERIPYQHYVILGVAGREGIALHIANLPEQLEGCIAIGEKFGMLDGKRAVLGSGNVPHEGFHEFMDRTNFARRCRLVIKEEWRQAA